MTIDLATFLVAVYTCLDTLYQQHIAPHKPCRRGPRPSLSDPEILTLMLVAQWRGSSERDLLRWADRELRWAFPRLLSQSAFNRRGRELGPVFARLMVELADLVRQLPDAPPRLYEVVDTLAVPLAQQVRGERHRLFADEAALGRGGAGKAWFYGCSLLLAVGSDGPITGCVLGSASTEGRWLLDSLLTWRVAPDALPATPDDLPPSHARGGVRVGPTGPRWFPGSAGAPATGRYLADQGFTGAHWHQRWRECLGATVLTTTRDMARGDRRWHGRARQVVETVNGQLTEVLHLRYPRAKTAWGVVTRVLAKCAAFNLGVWLNRLLGRPTFALATLFPG